MKGTDGDDDLTLTSGNDNYEPTSGSDTVNGGDGEDTLIVLRGTQIIKSKDVFGVYTGTIDKTYFSIKLEGGPNGPQHIISRKYKLKVRITLH